MATTRKTTATRTPKAGKPMATSVSQSEQLQDTDAQEQDSDLKQAKGYVVQDSLNHDGNAYQVGDLLVLTDDQVKALPAGIVMAVEE